MSDGTMGEALPPAPNPTERSAVVKSAGRVKAAAWTAGITAFFVLAANDDSSSWPAAFVSVCVVAMVAYVCYLILYYR
jgi:hypothetical protein